jgi:hypothetical protein
LAIDYWLFPTAVQRGVQIEVAEKKKAKTNLPEKAC